MDGMAAQFSAEIGVPFRANPVYVLGDSHVRYFLRGRDHGLYAPREMEGLEVGGATAVGMRNPNAATNALLQFRSFLDGKNTDAFVVIQLGEVDCDHVAWFRAQKYGENVQDQIDQSITAYFDFVDETIARGFAKVIITAATLPTISDEDQAARLIIGRSNISVSQRDRTDLALLYNRKLTAEAARRALPFVDVTADVLDPDTNLVNCIYRNADPLDHHMHYKRAVSLWACHLNAALNAVDPILAPMKRWRFRNSSFAKGLTTHSAELPDDLKVRVSPGSEIIATHLSSLRDMEVITNARLDGQPLDPRIRMFPRDHAVLISSAR